MLCQVAWALSGLEGAAPGDRLCGQRPIAPGWHTGLRACRGLLHATGCMLNFVILNGPHVHGTTCEWLTRRREKNVFPLPQAAFILGCPVHPQVCTQVLCRGRPVPCTECTQQVGCGFSEAC